MRVRDGINQGIVDMRSARVARRDPVSCAWFQLVRFRESFGFQQNFVVDPGRCNVVGWALTNNGSFRRFGFLYSTDTKMVDRPQKLNSESAP